MSNLNDTLYVGIDVAKLNNQVYAMNFDSKKLLSFSAKNDNEGASVIEAKLVECLNKNNMENVVIILESTGVYSYHISVYLSTSDFLRQYNCLVYCINPKTSKNFRSSFSDMDKTDPKDSFVLADMGRCGRYKGLHPVNGPGKLAMQRLTRHRRHISECICREKAYVLNNIFLKFSAYNTKIDGKSIFSNTFSVTSYEVLLEYKSPQDIIDTPISELVEVISKASRNRTDPNMVAETLKKAARKSYRLEKAAYDPINTAIASSLCILRCYESELKSIDKEILNLVKNIKNNEYDCLISIPGIGPVFAAGIISEIGSIFQFPHEESLAKYAGITWRTNQSGNFKAEDTPMTKTGNSFLRYYLIEAAQLAVLHNPVYKEYYDKKFNEVTKHQHTRALVLTSRKLVRLIHGLMSKSQLYKA